MNPVWITLGPVLVINCVLLTSYLIFQLWGAKRIKKNFEGAKKGESKFLSGATREWWFWTTDPIVKLFVKLKLGPNAITSMGFSLAIVAAFLFSQGSFGYAGWTMIFGASFDMFDGRVARITGKVSRSGAFYDAVMDRFGEGLCLLGLAWFFQNSFMLLVVVAALIGSLLVSYTKARAESQHVECNVGTMQRPERIVYLGVASVFDPIAQILLAKIWTAIPPHILVMLSLILIAVMTIGTAVYRMIYVMNKLDTEDRKGHESIPQIIAKLSTPAGREKFWEHARYGYDRTLASFSHVVLFLMDGVDRELFHKLLRQGDLPNILKNISMRGSDFFATSAFPTTTGPAVIPFVTGCFPGTCNIPASRWFDRTIPEARILTMNRFRDYLGWGAYVMDHDLSKSVRTIFEYSRQAVNIFGMLNRGCGLVRDTSFFKTYGRFHNEHNEEFLTESLEAAFHWFSSAIKRETDFVLYSFPPVKPSTESYKTIDEYVGRAAEFLKKTGIYDDSALIFTSTHGHAMAGRFFDLESFLSRRFKTVGVGQKLKQWHSADLIALPSGTSMAHMYVRSGGGWGERSFFEDIERRGLVGSFLEQDEIDILSGRSVEGGIVVQSRRGRAHIFEDADGRITYRVKGNDPFTFSNVPQIIDGDISLSLSSETTYPDGIQNLLQIFRSRRAGDLVVTTEKDVVFVSENDLHSTSVTHGALSREHALVPICSSVSCNLDVMRSVDVFAWVMNLLGIEILHALDGCFVPDSSLKAKEEAV